MFFTNSVNIPNTQTFVLIISSQCTGTVCVITSVDAYMRPRLTLIITSLLGK